MNSTPADEHKFLELVNENRNKILRICRVYAWNSADQDDLYQEILFQIWRGLPGLKEKQFANTWLYRVAINTAISFVRKRASRSDRVVHFEHADLTRAIESRQSNGREALTTAWQIFTPRSTNWIRSKKRSSPFSWKTSPTSKLRKPRASMPIMLASCCTAPGRNFPALMKEAAEMNDDELKKLWQQQPLREPPSAAQLVSAMQSKTTQLRRTLLARDRARTFGLRLSSVSFLGFSFSPNRAPIARLGDLIVIGSSIFIAWKLVHTRRTTPSGAARRDHRRISAGGTEFGAHSVAFIGVGAVVVFASADDRRVGLHLG